METPNGAPTPTTDTDSDAATSAEARSSRHLSEVTTNAGRVAADFGLAKGQRGALVGAALTHHLLMYWGIPHDEAEPICAARAQAERELSRLHRLAATLEGLDHPAGQVHLVEIERDRDEAELWWSSLVQEDFGTAHSRAQTADEYTILMTPMPAPARSRGIDFESLKQRIDITSYVGRYTTLRPSGGKFVGRCPLPDHDDGTPSFWVYPVTRSWFCFGCNRGGDVIHFAQLLDGTTARDLSDE